MPRRTTKISTELPYHVTARCINRENFPISISETWKIMEDYLFFISYAFRIEIVSFVLMSNHFHLIIRSPDGNLSEAMNYFMGETSRQISRLSKRINQNYGQRFHRTLIENPFYLLHAYKYVYRNPVEAGLARYVEEYEYSTLYRKVGYGKLTFPISIDPYLNHEYYRTLRWLNEPTTRDERTLIGNGLKKAVFKIPKKDSQSGKLISLTAIDIFD